MNQENNKPIKEIKIGPVRAAIWTNQRQTRNGTPFNSHKIQIEHTYKDVQGQYQKTSSLDTADLPKAILALQKAYEYLVMHEEKNTCPSTEQTTNGEEQP